MSDPSPITFDPSKPFKVVTPAAPTSDAPVFDPSKPFKTVTSGTASAAAPKEDDRDLLRRMWDGLTSGDASTKAGSFGVGASDPYYGTAQTAQHLRPYNPMNPPEMVRAWMKPEEQAAGTRDIDQKVAAREQRYEETRQPKITTDTGGWGEAPESKLGTDWMRLLGNAVGGSPLAALGPAGAAARGAPLAARVGSQVIPGAVGGAIGGAAQPVASGDFGMEKLKQAALGGGFGAALGPVAGAVGAGLGAAGSGIKQLLSRGAAPAEGPLFTPAERAITARAEKALPVRSTDNIHGYSDLTDFRQQRLEVLNDMAENTGSLKLDTAKGWATGRMPVTLEEGLQTVQQGKNRVFQQFDKMQQEADLAPLAGPSPIIKFNNALDEASKRLVAAQEEAKAARQAALLGSAQQSRAGEQVHLSATANTSARQAARALERAEAKVESAETAKTAALADVRRPWVDLKPVATELETFGHDPIMSLKSGNTALYALKEAKKFADTEAISAAGAQKYIKLANDSLQAFYKNPTYETAARAGVDARIASVVRKQLDEMITNATGPGYQKLKNLHGGYQALEDQMTRRLTGQPGEEPFINRLMNAGSIEEVMRGLITMNPTALARGALLKGVTASRQASKTADRQVMKLFQEVQRQRRGGSEPGMFYRMGPGSLPTGAGGAAADEERNVRRYSMPPPEDRWKGTGGTVQ